MWPAQRGNAAGAAAVTWDRPDGGGTLREWHFSGKGNKRYKRGITVWASPALGVIDDRPIAFIGGCDQTLHALDLLSKEERWNKITNGEITDAPALGSAQGSPAVFWGSSDRYIYAADARSGRMLWSCELIPPRSTLGDVRIHAPLLHAGVLYATSFAYDKSLPANEQSGVLHALDTETGRILWTRSMGHGPLNAPTGVSIGNQFMLFVPAQKGLLTALNVSRDGASAVWTFQMPHEVLASPAVEINRNAPLLFLGSKFGDLIALDVLTGQKRWARMTGNWVDNNACIAELNGTNVVFVGSHDYSVYALEASTGQTLWRRPLGGEVFSAPAFLGMEKEPLIAVACLDNHIYLLNAADGRVATSFYTGEPIWDKVTKGENLWGSPAAIMAGEQSAIIHGSYNGSVYVLPVNGSVALRTKARQSSSLWVSLGVTAGIFLLVIVPVCLRWPRRAA
jgi:outer membrane protein assembly factor BamB